MKIYQIKSSWYYIFWGIMAVAVVGGQIYIGSGYRKMAEVTKSALNKFTCLSRYGDVSLREYNKTREFE